ncbi:hypothetical protein [Stenomitos frigidus]|uniref:Uncharacterized protein n=1 Tax=Stenomitos frigidus ULC18 TaxID=2107698 RepID=A0A2T1E4D3_9CYAN|nr:hypothetical protein [Stenomitos frigidus]PSB27494.1 hypothetical protein C7B82_16415 [Stenomitos frigidus ULC18]
MTRNLTSAGVSDRHQHRDRFNQSFQDMAVKSGAKVPLDSRKKRVPEKSSLKSANTPFKLVHHLIIGKS